jgi:hypothetical protein
LEWLWDIWSERTDYLAIGHGRDSRHIQTVILETE